MEKQEWLDACAAQFIRRAKMLPEDATHHASVCLESVNGDLTESPEDAADEEMSNWAN